MSLRAIALVLVGLMTTFPARSDETALRTLAAHDERLRTLLESESELAPSARGFATLPSTRHDRTTVELGTHAGDPIRIRAGRRNQPLVELYLVGTRGAYTLERGRLGYPHAPAATGWMLQRGELFEHLLLLERRPESPIRFELVLGPAVARVRHGASLDLLDAWGDVALRVHSPYVIDAEGRRRELVLVASEPDLERRISCELVLPSDLALPALMDPAFEVVLWQKRSVAGPTPRMEHAMAYSTAHAALLFGGLGTGATSHGDFWAFDGTSWSEHAGGPLARHQHAMAFREGTGDLVLFGGFSSASQRLGDAWVWNGSAWSELAGTLPSARTDHAMTYVPSLSGQGPVVVMTGGYGDGFLWDTWLLSGTAFSQASPPVDPGPRRSHSLVSDGTRALSFGGLFGNAPSGELWHYDGTSWAGSGPSPVPPRHSHSAAFDSARGVLVVHGGADYDQRFDDTWEWESATLTWTERAPLTTPGKRSGATMVYDSVRKRAVLFGGFDASYLGDTWEYRVLGGTCLTAADCDGFACVDGACCSVASCGSCELCSVATGACEPVLNGEDLDSCTGPSTCDGSGACKSKNGTECSSDAECASGHCADGRCCNLACAGACEACDIPGQLGECGFVTGAARHGTCSVSPTPCGKTCLGQGPDCAFALIGTSCGATCSDAAITLETCDGAGACVAQQAEPCANGFVCLDANDCRTACEDDADCQAGRACRDGACVVRQATCIDGHTLLDVNGDTIECSPYACVGNACIDECATSDQCATGFACDADHHCVVPEDAGSEDVGCGCRSSSARAGGSPLVVLLVALGLRTRRTRRRGG